LTCKLTDWFGPGLQKWIHSRQTQHSMKFDFLFTN